MKMNRVSFVATVLMLALVGTAVQADEVLERNKTIEQMKNKEAKLKLQSEMSKHYQQMQQSGFYVDEDGQPLGITSIEDLAEEFRTGGSNNQGGMQFEDPNLMGGFPQMPQASTPQISDPAGRQSQRAKKEEGDPVSYTHLTLPTKA